MTNIGNARMRSLILCGLLIVSILVNFTGIASAQGPLTETYTSEDNLITFDYPEDWLVEEISPGLVEIANSEEALAAGRNLEEGQAILVLQTPLLTRRLPLERDVSPEEVISAFIEAEDLDIPVTRVVEITVGGNPAAHISSNTASFSIMAVEIEDGEFVILLALTGPDTLDEFMPSILDIAGTLALPENALPDEISESSEIPELTETYTAVDGSLQFDYPHGWVIEETDARMVYLASSENFGFPVPNPGETVGMISVYRTREGETPAGELDSLQSPGEPHLLTIGGRRAAWSETTSGQVVIVDLIIQLDDETFGMIVVLTVPGDEILDHEAFITALAESLIVPTASEDSGLPRTYTTDQGWTFDYPAGWELEEADTGTVVLTLGEPFAERGIVASGEVWILMSTVGTQYLTIEEDADLFDVMAAFLSTNETPIEFNRPIEFRIGSRVAARSDTWDRVLGHVVLLCIEVEEDIFGFFMVITADEEWAQFEPTILAIVDSLRYSD